MGDFPSARLSFLPPNLAEELISIIEMEKELLVLNRVRIVIQGNGGDSLSKWDAVEEQFG